MPWYIKEAYLRIQTQVLAEIHRTSFRSLDTGVLLEERAWKLFLLLPRLLLHKTTRGGKAGERNLRQRISLFDAGCWDVLLRDARELAVSKTFTSNSNDFERRLQRALQLIKDGELSYAARTLESHGLAPGTQSTLDELKNPQLRPPNPVIPPFLSFHIFESPSRIILDKHIFIDVLKSTRRGLSAGLSLHRNKFLRLYLEDNLA